MFKFLKLYDVGYKKIRVGPKKDGGYILLKELNKLRTKNKALRTK